MFRREFSLAMFFIWFLTGALFAGIWYLTTGQWPPLWARLAGVAVLFPVLMPFEAALARLSARQQRRRGATLRREAR
ncbi:hypothetical protein ACFVYE_32135 [Streptomyces sp. NPDC058239]|uniref:hypothetical protein n=1 Tax=Streptomyces sp. NPDC058239 TaxID=3346395 RepID=UPI0036E30C03